MPRTTLRCLILGLACLVPPGTASAQLPASDTIAPVATPLVAPLITIGSDADDRLRLATLLGRDSTSSILLRSASTLTPALPRAGVSLQLLAPEVDAAWNSRIPYSLNDGSMWAGRGTAIRALAGVRARWGRLSLVVAPELTYSQNLEIDSLVLGTDPARSAYAPPWFTGRNSADLPQRFGDEPFTRFRPGQSSLTLDLGLASAGASTENEWWGPGIRNAIVLSNNAAGIPHLFARTSRPLETPLGDIEARWMLGSLRESAYFDTLSSNDTRALSAIAATLRPWWEPNLTFGVARAVYSGTSSTSGALGHVADALFVWPGERLDSVTERKHEQITSLFARWVFPSDGLEVYGEWARYELPRSLRDLLTDPAHTQGYTGGLQWARPTGAESVFRVQAEITYLEQDPSFRVRPIGSFYASRWVEQGYTQQGQPVGAGIGPGSSSQWLALDHFGQLWKVGIYGGRIRWQNDAYYDTDFQYVHLGIFGHDVTMLGGLRGGVSLWGTRIDADLTTAKRYNYLFQNRVFDFFQEAEPGRLVDVRNTTLRLTITPGFPR